MDKKKILKVVFFAVFIIFVIAYAIEKSGYYEYNLRKQTVMTNESMLQFEKDLSEGKDVTIEDYMVNKTNDYTTKLSRGTNRVSVKVNELLKKGIEGVFKVLGNFVEN